MPDTGSLRGDVEMLMAEVLAVWSDPANVAFLKALIAAQLEDGELGAAYHELTLRRRAIVVTMIDRAVDRGEVRSGVPTNMFYDIVLGAILQRMVLFGEPIDDAFIQALTLTILDGLLA